MNKNLCFVSTAMLVVAGLMAMGVSTVRAQTVVVSDSFTNTTLHPIHTSINGQAPEVGSGTYAAAVGGPFLKDSTSGLCAITNEIGGQSEGLGEIGIAAPTNLITVSADLFPTNFTIWDGLGFQASPSTNINDWYTTSNLLWLGIGSFSISNTQNLVLYADGGAINLGSIHNLAITPDEKVSLTYDPNAGEYIVQLNGATVLSGIDYLSGTIGSVGFNGNLSGITNSVPGGTPMLKNFLVTEGSAVITNQPASQSVYAGGTAQFTVGVYSTETPSYQWQIITNGNYVNLSDSGNISGSQTPTLTISNVTSANSGAEYVVVITNSYGSITSSVATLTVNQVNGNTIVSDSFTNTTLHPTYTSINGQAPEVGTGTWVAGASAPFLKDSTSGLCASSLGGGPAEIAIPNPTSAITVSAELFPTNFNAWDAIGFETSPSTGNWYGSGDLLWVAVGNFGKGGGFEGLVLYGNGAQNLGNPTITLTTPEEISLTYDPVSEAYSVSANGVQVLSGTYTLGGTIGSAGLMGNGQIGISGGTPMALNFSVKYAVPSAPVLTNSWNGSQLILSWPAGYTLETATNVLGPWTSNAAVSPVTVTPSLPQQFFRLMSN